MMFEEGLDVLRWVVLPETGLIDPFGFDTCSHLLTREADQEAHVDHVVLRVFRIGLARRDVNRREMRGRRQDDGGAERDDRLQVRRDVDTDLAVALLDDCCDRVLIALDVTAGLKPAAQFGMVEQENPANELIVGDQKDRGGHDMLAWVDDAPHRYLRCDLTTESLKREDPDSVRYRGLSVSRA